MDLRLPITRTELKELLDRPSASGILSIYLDPLREGRHETKRWAATLKNGLRELRNRYPDEKALAKLTEKAVEDLLLLPPEERQRSIVYFASLMPEWTWQRSFQLSAGTRFTWSNIPFVRPLIALVERWPTTGVLVYSQEAVRTFTLRQGSGTELPERRLEVSREDWRDYRGPARGNGSAGRGGSTHVEKMDARMGGHSRAFLRESGKEAGALADAEGWTEILLYGPAELADAVQDGLPPQWRQRVLGTMDSNLVGVNASEIVETALLEMKARSRMRQEEEVASLLDVAHAKANGAVGAQSVLDLLSDRRVQRLLFAEDLQLEGFRRANGTFGLGDSQAVEGSLPERHLVERMVELAYRSGATVNPVTGAAAAKLLETSEGVAALLHY